MVTHRKNNTREIALIQATLACVARHGLENTTVRKIAEAAGVTNGLIRFYFNTKDEMIRAAYGHFLDNILRATLPDGADDKSPKCRRLGKCIEAILSPPVTSADTVTLWASLLPMAQKDAKMSEIRRAFYRETLATFAILVRDAYEEQGREVEEAQLHRRVVALNSFIDGLWINGGAVDSNIDQDDLIQVGLHGAAALLGLPESSLRQELLPSSAVPR